jgi:hypothetical protein
VTGIAQALHKLARAEHHVNDFTVKVHQMIIDHTQNPASFTKTLNPEYSRFTFAFGEPLRLDETWSLIVGDAVNNVHAALDYLAWHLVDLGTEPKPLKSSVRNGIYFPVIDKRQDGQTWHTSFENRCLRYLPGVDPVHLQIIERYQPYCWGESSLLKHPFAIMNSLSKADKHRELQLTTTKPFHLKLSLVSHDHCEILDRRFLKAKDSNPGTEFAWITVRPTDTEEPEVNVKLTIDSAVAFARNVDEPWSEDEPWAEDTLRAILGMTRNLFDEFKAIVQ